MEYKALQSLLMTLSKPGAIMNKKEYLIALLTGLCLNPVYLYKSKNTISA